MPTKNSHEAARSPCLSLRLYFRNLLADQLVMAEHAFDVTPQEWWQRATV